MNADEFKTILERTESDTIDFKRELYNFGGTEDEKMRKRAKFAKDIICMANTPRDQSAYIVLGVIKHKDGRWEDVGVSTQVDGSEFQQQLEGWVFPHPKIHYEPLVFEGKNYGVIIIPVDKSIGPHYSMKDAGSLLKMNQLYHRRDSVNSEADAYWQGKIFEWFRDAPAQRGLSSSSNDPLWNDFVNEVDGFNKQRQFVLVVHKFEQKNNVPLENIGRAPWSFIIDFDPESEKGGVLSKCKENLEQHRVLHRVVKGEKPNYILLTGSYWYFARGILGRMDTLFDGKFREWQTQYDKDLRYQFECLAAAASAKPTTFIFVAESSDLANHYYAIASAANSAFGTSATFLVITQETSAFEKLQTDFDAKLLRLPLHHLCYGLNVLSGTVQQTTQAILPSDTNTPIAIPDKDLLWLEEELEVVHLNVGQKPLPDIIPGRDFLRGRTNEISWYELGLGVDVLRDLTGDVEKDLRFALSQRKVRRINLYHKPGAGGTTIARRTLWDLRSEYSAFILRRTKPIETADRLAFVYAMTQLPILLCLEGSEISDKQSDDLYEILAARQIPVTIMQVLRRSAIQQPRSGHYLDTTLSDAEVGRFVHQLVLYVPDKSDDLENAAFSLHQNSRSPFFLGLTAFERDFVSLERYVKIRIENLSSSHLQIMQYLALSYYYGQQSISAQSFAILLDLPLSRIVNLEDHLPEVTQELLVRAPNGKWRISHHLIAEEVLIQTLIGKTLDRRNWWHGLSDCAIRFIDFCRGPLPEPTTEGLELAQRIFLYRDNSDLLGTEQGGDRGGSPVFSQLISDIKLPESKLTVLIQLTKEFPDEPHFWAHLGRLYSFELRQFDKAVEAIDEGIRLLPNDNTLYHMRGMALRSSVYWGIAEKSEVGSVLIQAKAASEAFKKARKLDPVDEYGYISETQMITRVLDYLSKVKQQPAVLAVSNSDDAWIRESFQLAEDLLDQVRKIRTGEQRSEYELRCRADLDSLYGKHSLALQTWDNLLTRAKSKGGGEIYAPPIRRQIVWTLLSSSSKDRNWKELNKEHIARCVDLLDENLIDEPNDDRNLRLWIQAARFHSSPPSMESAIEKVAHWKSVAETLDATFYLYVLYAIQALNGFPLARDKAERALEECRRVARYRRDRTRSFEWLGKEKGLRQLVHQSTLGDWDPSRNFWKKPDLLIRETGIVIDSQDPAAGWIETPGGLKAFFVPGTGSSKRKSSVNKPVFPAGRFDNVPVTFFLGFSYDGLRAWSVKFEGDSDSED